MKISGEVIEGDGYGNLLGYPTVNIDHNDYLEQNLHLKLGVYAGHVKIKSTQEDYLSGVIIGPLDENGVPKLEAHLIGYAGNLYGEVVTFYIQEYIRPLKEYTSEELLKKDIAKDIELIKEMNACLPE